MGKDRPCRWLERFVERLGISKSSQILRAADQLISGLFVGVTRRSWRLRLDSWLENRHNVDRYGV